jgi:hypothetical protein
MLRVAEILIRLVSETLRWLRLSVRANMSVKAENLFLRRQPALHIERGVKPRRIANENPSWGGERIAAAAG